jgi:hypothetical protein
MLPRLLIGFLASCAVTLPASAEILTFDFAGKIDYIFEYESQTQAFTYPSSSSRSGGEIFNGDTFRGQFSYDTQLAPYSGYQPPIQASGTWVNYTSPPVSVPITTVTFEKTGFTAISSDDYQIMQVANNASDLFGQDIFAFRAGARWTPEFFDYIELAFFDSTGSVFNTDTLPTELDVSDFYYKNFHYAWSDLLTGNQFHVNGTITSISPVAAASVDEPAPIALFGLGMLGLLISHRRNIRN